MTQLVACRIAAGALPHLVALRLVHLEYIAAYRDRILFGGPIRDAEGRPEAMVIVLRDTDAAQAQAFIAAEPYNASGKVFAEVTIRPWSQVLPEAEPGALAAAIADERARVGQ